MIFNLSKNSFCFPVNKTKLHDHKDKNKLNNQRANIRLSDKSKNAHNRKVNINNTTGLRGVCYHKKAKKYTANITLNKKSIYIGLFDNKKLAAKAYNKKALELFGEFANLNKI